MGHCSCTQRVLMWFPTITDSLCSSYSSRESPSRTWACSENWLQLPSNMELWWWKNQTPTQTINNLDIPSLGAVSGTSENQCLIRRPNANYQWKRDIALGIMAKLVTSERWQTLEGHLLDTPLKCHLIKSC